MPVVPVENSTDPQLFNLVVLVRTQDKRVSARAANLAIPSTESSTIRDALSQLVTVAKTQLSQWVAQQESIPWIEPHEQANDSETRFVVPLHL